MTILKILAVLLWLGIGAKLGHSFYEAVRNEDSVSLSCWFAAIIVSVIGITICVMNCF